MARARSLAGVAGLVLLSALTGCQLTDCSVLALWQDGPGAGTGGGQLVVGAPEEVAFRMQSALQGLGCTSTLKHDAQGIRIEAIGPAKQKFALVLTRRGTDQGERTHVYVDWADGNRDAQLEATVLAPLQSRKP